jgi:hypothetical protein
MKGFICFIILLFLIRDWMPGNAQAKFDPPQVFRVVLVKGNPLRGGKTNLREGQKMEDLEKLMFTTTNDLVILLNADFEKIKIRPQSRKDLKKMIPIAQFRAKSDFVRLRGVNNNSEFQSVADSIKLHLVNDLRRSAESTISKFRLFDLYGESHSEYLKMNGEYLVVTSPKTGIFFLHYSKNSGNSEVLAEIEFLPKEEVEAELNYVRKSEAKADSILVQQKKYLLKVYPNLPLYQVNQLAGKF